MDGSNNLLGFSVPLPLLSQGRELAAERAGAAIVARALRAGAVRLYEEGRTGVLPVLDAIRNERDIMRELIDNLLGFQRAHAELGTFLGVWPGGRP